MKKIFKRAAAGRRAQPSAHKIRLKKQFGGSKHASQTKSGRFRAVF